MSAYALPGLFPPIDMMSQSCSIEESPRNKNAPLHLQDHDQNHNKKCDARNYGRNLEEDALNSSSSSNIGCILNSAAIAVKEAKIDPVRWIQYVTGSNPQQYAHQIGKTLRRRVGTSNTSSPVGSKRTLSDSLRSKSSFSNGGNSCNKSSKSQQNEAIEFELSITLNGRKYTAKRTMLCIMQLRDDLIREMKRRRDWLTRKEDSSTSTRPKVPDESSKMEKIHGHLGYAHPSKFDVTYSSTDGVQIPEIPPFTSDHDHGDTGLVGKGFTMLHAMVKSYVPVMESWLKNIMEIVPQDSECLMNFLWEPATDMPSACFKSVLDSVNNNDQMMRVSNKFKSSTSLATLGSIKEMDNDSEDEDSEDGRDEYSTSGWKE